MAELKVKLTVNVDHARLAKLIKKAIAKVEAAPEERRVEAVSEWVARIVHDCVRFEVTNDVPNVQEDS